MNRFLKAALHLTTNTVVDAQIMTYLVYETTGLSQLHKKLVTAAIAKYTGVLLDIDEVEQVIGNVNIGWPKRLHTLENYEHMREFFHALIEKDEKGMEKAIDARIQSAFGAFNEKDIEDAVMPTAH